MGLCWRRMRSSCFGEHSSSAAHSRPGSRYYCHRRTVLDHGGPVMLGMGGCSNPQGIAGPEAQKGFLAYSAKVSLWSAPGKVTVMHDIAAERFLRDSCQYTLCTCFANYFEFQHIGWHKPHTARPLLPLVVRNSAYAENWTWHGDVQIIAYRSDHTREKVLLSCPRPTTTKSASSSIAACRTPSGTPASRTRTFARTPVPLPSASQASLIDIVADSACTDIDSRVCTKQRVAR